MAETENRSDPVELDPEHELPAADEARGGASAGTEFDKLKTERDGLLDRLARLQAEFENARKRTAREQQEFREYAVTDALKALLPILDSFERALHTSASDKSEFRGGVNSSTSNYRMRRQTGTRPIPAKGEPR